MEVWFQTVALILILAAQVYRIIRSEVLLRQERGLHKKIEEHLGMLTPAQLWPQYQSLLNFYDRLQTEAKSYQEAVGDYQEQLAQAQGEVERLAAEVGSKDEEPDMLRAAKAAALVQRSDELGKRARQMLESLRQVPFYTYASFRQFVNTVVIKAATRGFIVNEELPHPVEGEEGSWWYEIISADLSVRIRRASEVIAW